ncbi:MAG: DUF692 family multinuclear iron-containing protein [Rickettsiales bacterium]
MTTQQDFFPQLGFGLGLRVSHYKHIFDHWPAVDWFEIISENFMDTDGRPKRKLARIRERYPIVMHGVAMSIGTVDPVNSEYMQKLKALMDWLKPAWVSDHLCWTGIAHKNSHDLLPMPYTEESLKHTISRIKQVQDFLERPIALENPSTYLEFKASDMGEAEFIARMVEESGCHLLLDVNNVYVSSFNHRLDAQTYIDTLPLDKVVQIHLSGHTNRGTHIIDTHDDHVVDEVWALYKYVVHKAGRTPNTMVEWDDNIPEFSVLDAELTKAKEAARDAANYAPLPQLAVAHAPYVANHATPLADTQTRMQTAILEGARLDSKPDEWIRTKNDFPAEAQLAVYTNAYRGRLFGVTAEDYLVLKHYLGEARFDTLITDFVNQAQSTHFNISRYPLQLPQFLATHETSDPFALELATLEACITRLMDEAETAPLEPQHLEGMDAETLMESKLHPRAALELLVFDYPVNAYYRAVKDEQSPAAPAPEKNYLAVFRHEDAVWRMDLEADEYSMLRQLFAGLSIGDALEAVQAEHAIADEAIGGLLNHWFPRWMRNGILAHHPDNAANKRSAA